MGKRLTDTDIWKEVWFRKLSSKAKCLFFYIKDQCDNAGVWEGDFAVASMQIGDHVTEKDLAQFGTLIKKIDTHRFWLPWFIDFQFGELTMKSKVHLNVMKLMQKHKLNIAELETLMPSEQLELALPKQPPDKDLLTADIFADEKFCEALLFKTKTMDKLREAWENCFLWHSQDPNSPSEIYWWRQKLTSWVIKPESLKNGKQKHTTRIEGLATDFTKRHSSPSGQEL